MVCFKKPMSTTRVLAGKLRNSRWRPRWPPFGINFPNSLFLVGFFHVISCFIGFWVSGIQLKYYFYIWICFTKINPNFCNFHGDMSRICKPIGYCKLPTYFCSKLLLVCYIFIIICSLCCIVSSRL